MWSTAPCSNDGHPIEMPTEIVMPRLGWDMKVGSVSEWRKQPGEHVEAGEVICVIEGDKATSELEAEGSGTLHVAAPAVGAEMPVGTLLGYLLAPGEAPPAPNGATRVVATPRARRAAAALGVDWRSLHGSGRGGRILERDIERAAAEPNRTPTAAPPAPTPSSPDVPPAPAERAQPLHGSRRLTAERLARSARSVVPVTLTTEADATALARLRQEAADAEPDTAPSYTDLLIKIVALALSEHPALNASLTEQGIVEHRDVHIALAVDTPQGLVAPVIRDAAHRSVHSIATESRRLTGAAHTARLTPDDQHGATFTISNLGMYEIDAFTPVVNLPECAILGVGRVVARAVVTDEATDRIEVRRMLALSLTFDHRLVDGAPAARFLQRVKHLVERPTLWVFR
jgi:pyruvate dehydrogenase E2 component (dihydrolipoamide acetyltransferase)